jgi:tetratricopeptide (TPR) repeat protein
MNGLPKSVWGLLLCLVFWLGGLALFGAPVPAAESAEDFQRNKARILLEKALKAQQRGEVEEALAALDDSFEAYPADKRPLFLKAEVLCRFGLFKQATHVISQLAIPKFPPPEQALIHLFRARIAIAEKNLESAAVCFADALKAQKQQPTARIRLALINEFLGSKQRSAELLEGLESFEGTTMRDQAIALTLRFLHGDFSQAWSETQDFAAHLSPKTGAEEEQPFLLELWQNPLVLFFSQVFFALGNAFGILYIFILLIGLAVLSQQITSAAGYAWDLLFVILAGGHMLVTFHFAGPDMVRAMLADHFDLYSPVWIGPRLLCSIHTCTICFFLIFPIFRLLPEGFRPQKFELYSIWFFCFWFSLFVLLFQSRLPLGMMVTSLAISLVASGISSLFMPLGRYLLYLVGGKLGFKAFLTLPPEGLSGGAGSFTDGKIQEVNIARQLQNEEFDQVIPLAKKLLVTYDPKAFSEAWLHLIQALLEKEDIFEAERRLQEYGKAFTDSGSANTALLLLALFKSIKGDHAGAHSLIRNISDETARSFSAEQVATLLYVLGRCNLFFKEPVQAHIDFSKGLASTQSPLLKTKILIELTEMDLNMSRLEWTQKWLKIGKSCRGGRKTQSNIKIIESMVTFGQGNKDPALQLAEEACRLFPQNVRAWCWQGHVLCSLERFTEAEALLAHMTAGTYEAEKLMQELTGKKHG